MAETAINLAEYGVVNARPAHTLQPGELVSTSGCRVKRGDPFNIYPALTWVEDTVQSIGGAFSVPNYNFDFGVMTFDDASLSYYATLTHALARITPAGGVESTYNWSTGSEGPGGSAFTKYREIYLQGSARWDEYDIATTLKGAVFTPREGKPLLGFENHRMVLWEYTAGVLNGIFVGSMHEKATGVPITFDTVYGSYTAFNPSPNFADYEYLRPSTAAGLPQTVSDASYAQSPFSSIEHYFVLTGSNTSGTVPSFDEGEVYVYWFRFYCRKYDILMPPKYVSQQTCMIVEMGASAALGTIVLDTSNIALTDQEFYEDTSGNNPFDAIRIYRARCRDLNEASAIVRGMQPLIGALVSEVSYDNGTFGTLSRVYDSAGSKYNGTVQYPNVQINEAGQTFIFDKIRKKEPYDKACVFQGSLLTNAPRIAEDILVYTPPGEPWYNPVPYFIQISSTESSALMGLTVLNNVALALYRDRIARINYLPFTGETGLPVWEYITTNRGPITPNAWCRFDTEQGNFVAMLTVAGLYATDGRTWFPLAPGWSLPALYELGEWTLMDDPDRDCLIAHYTDWEADRVTEWTVHYDSTHFTERGLKVFGPTLLDASIEAVHAGVQFTDPNPAGLTTTGFLRKNVVWTNNANGSLEVLQRQEVTNPAPEMQVVAGDFHPTAPKHTLRVQRIGFFHSADSGTLSWTWSKHETGQSAYTYDEQTISDLSSRGFTDRAQSLFSGRYLTLQLDAAPTSSSFALGPVTITTQGGEGGKNDS